MKPFTRVGPLLLCALALANAIGARPARASIDSETRSVAQNKLLAKGSLGVQIIRLGNSPAEMKDLYDYQGHVPLIPASNLKVVTTSAAMDRLGPQFKFRTLLILRDKDLVLVGDGDPSFGDAEYLRKLGWTTTTVFENWVQQLKKMGVTSVANVVVDDSVFDDQFTHPDWPEKDMNDKYQAQVAGMNLNANLIWMTVQPTQVGSPPEIVLDPRTSYLSITNKCVTGNSNAVSVSRQPNSNQVSVRGQTPSGRGSTAWATVHDPPLYAATVLAETAKAGGVTITGSILRDRGVRQERIRDGDAQSGRWRVVGIHETPLATVLSRANKDSINLYAESLCKRLGYDPGVASGSWIRGTEALGAFLKKTGVPTSDFRLADGSGLSRQNTISPRALARVMCFDYYSPNRDAYLATLSVAGVDGTLGDEFRGSDLRKRVFGKSGFLTGVSSLTGFLHAKNGEWYAFSIIMNGVPYGGNSTAKLLQERIVKAVDDQAK